MLGTQNASKVSLGETASGGTETRFLINLVDTVGARPFADVQARLKSIAFPQQGELIVRCGPDVMNARATLEPLETVSWTGARAGSSPIFN